MTCTMDLTFHLQEAADACDRESTSPSRRASAHLAHDGVVMRAEAYSWRRAVWLRADVVVSWAEFEACVLNPLTEALDLAMARVDVELRRVGG